MKGDCKVLRGLYDNSAGWVLASKWFESMACLLEEMSTPCSVGFVAKMVRTVKGKRIFQEYVLWQLQIVTRIVGM